MKYYVGLNFWHGPVHIWLLIILYINFVIFRISPVSGAYVASSSRVFMKFESIFFCSGKYRSPVGTIVSPV